MLSYKESLEILKRTDALLEGHFILSSGLHSKYYIQCAQLLCFPREATLICSSLAEKIKNGKASVLGAVTGSIAGLAAITPASGEVGPIGALAIGAASGFVCWYASVILKAKLGYDDSLDVVGVHGVGGLVGTLLVAFFAASSLGGKQGADYAIGGQFMTQLTSSAITVVYTLVLSFIILKVVGIVCGGLRVSESEEQDGLDISAHGESGYN